jgi:hypothetical protein
MIKKQLLVLIILLVSINVFSQSEKTEKPDYKKIKKEISKEISDLFYAKLLKRFMGSDTTMSLKEKRYLYYGYSFQKSYSPYGHSDFTDSLGILLQKEQHNDTELNKIILFSDSVLADNPFDLRSINYQLYAYEKLENSFDFVKKINQMRIIIDALLSSGDGLKKKTAFYVIYISHEYDLLNILGFEFGGEQSLIEHYDYLKVAKNPQKIKGFYFDVSPCLNSMKDMFK